VVGETGIVVPPSAPAALANGIEALLKRPRTPAWREELRRRVVENLGVERLIEETAAVLRQVVSERS
jgi:glycosyltransferase involved in cell wall biosynthesis